MTSEDTNSKDTSSENKAFEDTTYEDILSDDGKSKMTNSNNSSRGLFPLFLVSLAFTAFLGSQIFFLICDQNALTKADIQQSKTIEQIDKVKNQLGALAKGTMTLAGEGNKNAQEILDQLKRSGINIQDRPQNAPEAPPQKP